jgi:hypothetical protein
MAHRWDGWNHVNREEANYFNLVSRYAISVMFSRSCPQNGTRIGPNEIIKPSSEQHRLESELNCVTMRRNILKEFNLDLDVLAIDPRIG